jgi:glycosyltransferase involved in cell wall biosynthesis
MKILIYTHSWYPFVTGITYRYTQIVEQLKRNNHIVLVTPYDSPDYDGITTIRIPGCEIPSFYLEPGDKRESRIGDLSQYLPIYNTIHNACIEHKIDIVHCSGPDSMQTLLKAVCYQLNLPLVCMYHTNFISYFNTYEDVPNLFYTFTIPQQFVNLVSAPHLLVLPSNAYYRDLLNHNIIGNKQPYYIMPLCVDETIFYPSDPTKIDQWTPNKTKLLYVGRIELEKSIDIILNSMDKTMSLCVVGKGNDKERLLGIAKERNMDIKFIGLVDSKELRYWYSSCDIFIMPSRSETLGFVTLEAMACGAAICGCNEGGTIDIIKHRYNGLLFDTSKQLKKYMRKLVKDISFRQELINNGLDFIKDKTIANSVNGLFKKYKRLVAI